MDTARTIEEEEKEGNQKRKKRLNPTLEITFKYIIQNRLDLTDDGINTQMFHLCRKSYTT